MTREHTHLIHPGDIVRVAGTEGEWRVVALVSNLPGGPHLDLVSTHPGTDERETTRVVMHTATVLRCVA